MISLIKKRISSNVFVYKNKTFFSTNLKSFTTVHQIKFTGEPSNCWKCGSIQNQHSLFCLKCGKVQKINISESERLNLFEIFDIKTDFPIDLKELENSFKAIQMKLHPDKFANKTITEQEASLVSSSSVNQAYQVQNNCSKITVRTLI